MGKKNRIAQIACMYLADRGPGKYIIFIVLAKGASSSHHRMG